MKPKRKKLKLVLAISLGSLTLIGILGLLYLRNSGL